MRHSFLFVLVIAVAFAAQAGSGAAAPGAVAKPCKPGWRHAVIGGDHKCLRAGQRCSRANDRRYHRYGFHCHGRRLTRPAQRTSAPPASPPATSPPAVRSLPVGPVPPGTYQPVVFRPRLHFTVESGWINLGEGVDGFELVRREGDNGLGIGFSIHYRLRSVADAVGEMSRVPGLSATAAAPVTVGGASGQRFTVAVTASSPVTLFGVPQQYAYVLHPGDAARVDVVDVRGERVVIIVEAPAGELAAFAAEADRVLGTLTFPA